MVNGSQLVKINSTPESRWNSGPGPLWHFEEPLNCYRMHNSVEIAEEASREEVDDSEICNWCRYARGEVEESPTVE